MTVDKRLTVAHVSWLKRDDGELGGVEKFADYLRAALRAKGWGVILIGWSDFPHRDRFPELPNPEKALLLGKWIDGPQFGVHYDVAVSDGYWGLGISSKPVVPVIHGTWAEFHERMGLRPGLEVQRQGEAFNAPNAFPVACSAASARELRRHHGRAASAVICHGIDLAAYHPCNAPLPPGPPWVVIEAAGRNEKKGAKLIPRIAALLGSDYRIEYLGAGRGEEPAAFRRGHVFLLPTRHEGNAYSCLEALASGLPVVTGNAGVFEDIQRDKAGLSPVGYTLPITATAEDYATAVRAACARVKGNRWGTAPRAWAEQNANMTDFANRWDGFLRDILGAR